MDKNAALLEQTAQNNRLLKAVLAMLVYSYEKEGGVQLRSELLLAGAGLDYKDIAQVLNKKPDAVRMLLKRNKKHI